MHWQTDRRGPSNLHRLGVTMNLKCLLKTEQDLLETKLKDSLLANLNRVFK